MSIKLYDAVIVKHFEGDMSGVVVDITPRHYIVYSKSSRSLVTANKEMVVGFDNGVASFNYSHPLTIQTGKIVFDKDRFPGFDDAVRSVVLSCLKDVIKSSPRPTLPNIEDNDKEE